MPQNEGNWAKRIIGQWQGLDNRIHHAGREIPAGAHHRRRSEFVEAKRVWGYQNTPQLPQIKWDTVLASAES